MTLQEKTTGPRGTIFMRVAARLIFLTQGVHKYADPQQGCEPVMRIGFPHPAFTARTVATATFIGYLLAGMPGAAVETVRIFLPSFLYVALLAPDLFRLRQSPMDGGVSRFGKCVRCGSDAGATFKLAVDAWRRWPSRAIAIIISRVVLLRWNVNPAWVVLSAGIAALLLAVFHWWES